MGILPEEVLAIQQAPNRQEATLRLEAVRRKFQVSFRKLVLELHPDRNQGDLKKAELLRILLDLKTDLEGIQLPAHYSGPGPRLRVTWVARDAPVCPPVRPPVRTSYFPQGATVEVRPAQPTPSSAVRLANLCPRGVSNGRAR
jgi:hypothetical protein